MPSLSSTNNIRICNMYERQEELMSAHTLSNEKILVVGVGAIGRQVVNTLTSMGATNITVCDMDEVDESNVATQGYSIRQIGQLKVLALCSDIANKNNVNVNVYERPWNPKIFSDSGFTILFSCVDRMDVRRSLWIYATKHNTIKYFMDGRMLAEMGHVFCYERDNLAEYEKTLFTDEEAIQGRCTRRGTLYMANILSNMMVGRLALAMRGTKAKPKYTFNLVGEFV